MVYYVVVKGMISYERRDTGSMKKKTGLLLTGIMLFVALIVGISSTGKDTEAAGAAATEESPNPEATAPADGNTVSGPAVDISQIAINKQKTIVKVGKKSVLEISGTPSQVVWTSENSQIATVSETGSVKGVKTGKTVVTASVDGITLSCNVTVVAKMTKKDFGKFSGENFVAYCQRMGYNGGYAWKGQWKGNSKKRSTYRKIKIGATKAKVEKAYGDFNLEKCKAKDPFTKMKGLKKNKVKYYNDEVWGRYRIRFYYNSKKKVVAIILACNIGEIKKKDLKKYL